MVARISTGALWGVDAYNVDVEVSLTKGLPNIVVIGLPDGAVREARMRIETSIRSLDIPIPSKRVTISLAPSDRKKAGSGFDLPMAVGFLQALGSISPESVSDTFFYGELGLDGNLRPVRGILSLARLAKKSGCRAIIVPEKNAEEAAVINGIKVYGADSLKRILSHLDGNDPIIPAKHRKPMPVPVDDDIDLIDVRGQPVALRALEIAAAGGHHILFIGPPGTGKSMLARRLPGILPPLDIDESLDVTKIYSAAGLLGNRSIIETRPFRAPHHTATETALIGGGHHNIRVGELTLAHSGILFLDEAAEFPRTVLDSLREPIENGEVDICRAEHRVRLPARCRLVIALNPCPCGYRGQEARGRSCTCSSVSAERYIRRLSGPLLDRVDVQIELAPVPMEKLHAPPDAEPSSTVRERVLAAHRIQAERLERTDKPALNAWMSPKETKKHCVLEAEAVNILHSGAMKLGLSARGIDRVLRVARTAADIDGAAKIRTRDILEALSYRTLEYLLQSRKNHHFQRTYQHQRRTA